MFEEYERKLDLAWQAYKNCKATRNGWGMNYWGLVIRGLMQKLKISR
jgi:hypothetical protein